MCLKHMCVARAGCALLPMPGWRRRLREGWAAPLLLAGVTDAGWWGPCVSLHGDPPWCNISGSTSDAQRGTRRLLHLWMRLLQDTAQRQRGNMNMAAWPSMHPRLLTRAHQHEHGLACHRLDPGKSSRALVARTLLRAEHHFKRFCALRMRRLSAPTQCPWWMPSS